MVLLALNTNLYLSILDSSIYISDGNNNKKKNDFAPPHNTQTLFAINQSGFFSSAIIFFACATPLQSVRIFKCSFLHLQYQH